ARASVRHLPRGRCVLMLDDTQQTDHCTLSTLALAYGGRALPLAWCRWSGQLEGQYWQQIDQLFEQATRILPPHVQPVLLADRGLASPKLITLVRQRGWDYVLRVQGADRAQRLLLGIMLAMWCGVLLGEAAIRAGEIPAYGRRAHAVSLLRRGLDWLVAPPRARFFRWTLAPPKTVRI